MAVKAEVIIDTAKCTGCRLCMLACSWINTKAHRPHDSLIRVDVDERDFICRVELDRVRCTGCLSCVSFCPSGALQAVRAENEVTLEKGA